MRLVSAWRALSRDGETVSKLKPVKPDALERLLEQLPTLERLPTA